MKNIWYNSVSDEKREGGVLMLDLTEYERVVRKYTGALYKYCFFRLDGNVQLAEEIVDDVLHILYRKWDGFDSEQKLRAFLYRAADLEIRNHKKHGDLYYKYNESLEAALYKGNKESFLCYDEYFADHTPEDDHIECIRARLPEELRIIFTLRFMEKRKLEDIAYTLGIPYSTLRLRIKRLERILKEEVKNIFENS